MEFRRTAIIHLNSVALLSAVCGGLMVEDCVPIDSYANLVGFVDQIHQFLLRPPFGTNRTFCVELAEVVEIVDVIAIAGRARGFATGRNPYIVDTGALQVRKGPLKAIPVLMVIRDIPFKACEGLRINFVLPRAD